jgi:hypothetical protein
MIPPLEPLAQLIYVNAVNALVTADDRLLGSRMYSTLPNK